MPNIGFQELLLIFIVAMLLFGANKIPELGRGLGQAIHEFKKAMAGEPDEKPARRRGGRRGGKADA
jgi:sec-independent protein translocase protein TatA